MPSTKAEIVAALQLENQTVIGLLLLSQKGPSAPSTSDVEQNAPSKISTVKLPTFYEHDTRQWFDQIEQILTGSSDDTCKNSLLRALPTSVIRDTGVNVTAPFSDIKNRIITHFDDTLDQKLRKLLKEQRLGDQKPSTALRRLQQLAPGNDSLVRIRFLEMLPTQARVVLATFQNEDLAKLAEAADKIIDQIPTTSNTNAIASSGDLVPAATPPPAADLTAQIAELTRAVSAINTQFQEFKNNRSRSSSRNSRPRSGSRSGSSFSRDSSRPPYDPNRGWCYYHFHYGTKARHCRSPCTWVNRTSEPSGNEQAPGSGRKLPE